MNGLSLNLCAERKKDSEYAEMGRQCAEKLLLIRVSHANKFLMAKSVIKVLCL